MGNKFIWWIHKHNKSLNKVASPVKEYVEFTPVIPNRGAVKRWQEFLQILIILLTVLLLRVPIIVVVGQASISSTLYARIFRTNVILADFFLRMYVRKKAAETTFVQNIRTFNVDEIDTW